MPDDLTKVGVADRSEIAMHEEHEVYYWSKHFGVGRDATFSASRFRHTGFHF
jgi:hypothetical protein